MPVKVRDDFWMQTENEIQHNGEQKMMQKLTKYCLALRPVLVQGEGDALKQRSATYPRLLLDGVYIRSAVACSCI